MKRGIRALCGGLALCMLLSLCGFAEECDGIRDSVLRLHVLAHSDSAEDQALKLKVRDAVVEASAGMLDGCADAAEAEQRIDDCLERLRQVAQEVVRQEGYTYPVTAERCRTYFTTRQYDNVTLPAGEYEAVRFVIGDGAGKNWWCVLFPPLCVSAATEYAHTSDVLTARQEDIVEHPENYEVRWKLLEWWEALRDWLSAE